MVLAVKGLEGTRNKPDWRSKNNITGEGGGGIFGSLAASWGVLAISYFFFKQNSPCAL